MDRYNRYTSPLDYSDELISILDELKKHLVIAGMNEFVISDENKYLIGTVGLAVCDGILFYDRKNKRAIVGHAAGIIEKKIKLISEMMNQLPKNNVVDLEYAIITGYDNIHNGKDQDTERMKDFLIRNCPENIRLKLIDKKTLDIRVGTGYGNEFIFNARNGTSASFILQYFTYLTSPSNDSNDERINPTEALNNALVQGTTPEEISEVETRVAEYSNKEGEQTLD